MHYIYNSCKEHTILILPNNSFSIKASRKTVKFKNYEKLQTKKNK